MPSIPSIHLILYELNDNYDWLIQVSAFYYKSIVTLIAYDYPLNKSYVFCPQKNRMHTFLVA